MNCIVVDDEEMCGKVLGNLVQSTDFLTLVKICSSAREALNLILKEKIDLILLDIEMSGMNGIELLEYVDWSETQVIFTTSSEKYALRAFDFDVTDYILKPISEERFLKSVLKAKRKLRISEDAPDKDIFVKVDAQLIKINTQSIFYIEAMTNYICIYAGTERYVVHSTMKGIESKLPGSHFLRIHNSYIVRIDKISAIDDNTVIVNKKPIPVSRSHWKNFIQRLNLV